MPTKNLSPEDFAKLRRDIGNGRTPKLSASERSQAETIYSKMQDAQTCLWNLSQELEEIIGCAVDTTLDLQANDLDSIIERDEPI